MRLDATMDNPRLGMTLDDTALSGLATNVGTDMRLFNGTKVAPGTGMSNGSFVTVPHKGTSSTGRRVGASPPALPQVMR